MRHAVPQRQTWERMARFCALGAGVVLLALFMLSAAMRLFYPYPLEWTEGYMVDHVARVLGPGDVYCAPSLGFMTFVYPPLYYWVSAAVALATGLGFLPLRLVSFVSSLASVFLIGRMVWRETDDAEAGSFTGLLYAATYGASGFFMDVARVDSLAFLLFLATLAMARRKPTVVNALLVGTGMTLAMLTKQTYLLPCLALAPFLVVRDWRRGMLALITTFVSMVLVTGILVAATDGWYWFFAFGASAAHGLRWPILGELLTSHFLFAVPVALVLMLVGLRRCVLGGTRAILLYGPTSLSLLGIGVLGRLSVGGAVNALLPAYAGVALLAGLGFARLHEIAGLRLRLAVYLGLILQFALLAWHPRTPLPTREDRSAGDRLISQMASYKGPVWLTCHGWLPVLAGKESAAPYAYIDMTLGKRSGTLHDEIQKSIESRRFDAIFYFGDIMPEAWKPYYRVASRVFEKPDSFYPVVGYQVRPKIVLVPREKAPRPDRATK